MARHIHTHLDEANTAVPSSPSSLEASTSDKENRHQGINKRTAAMPPPRAHGKRPRLADRPSNTQSGRSTQSARSARSAQSQASSQRTGSDTRYYDPDQDPEERRSVRRGLRDLGRELNDTRGELMQPGNHGILNIVEQANQFYAKVKQTADATLDSRILVNTADLTQKKATQLALGDTSAGIDVDEFVSKCISFMRRGPNNATATNGTQARRGRAGRSQRDPDASDEDDGDAMNWDTLGRSACFPSNARPAVSGWLLGPLSVQKRTRQMTQRRAQDRIDPSQAVAPREMEQRDLGQQESSNLTQICSEINKLLANRQNKCQEDAERELSVQENLTPEKAQEIMDKNGVADDGGIPLFSFCINPKSFGQSVENLFYVSFLVRDGTVGVAVDSRDLPTLHAAAPFAPSEAQKKGVQKHQAVFSLDHETWHEIIDVFNIEESIIPHREEKQQETGTSWYA
ncbi:Nse4 [Penicillium griseofulvum]|uniref:Non-structural maintenance of chromosomes element 4 n=1 Tax=Penicillium patulum TaxID=5078 RepID=A0A135LLS8_PENPA|nr:Nse4 [Penicillium griseofulvum]KXG49903.1 Nse4 [Penicillium griseofulvum]